MSALKLAAEETLCKIPEIQSELATVLGYKCAFDSIPGIFFPQSMSLGVD